MFRSWCVVTNAGRDPSGNTLIVGLLDVFGLLGDPSVAAVESRGDRGGVLIPPLPKECAFRGFGDLGPDPCA